ncbi:MAG: hypothetical protein ACRC46_04680 [Thermoguttaceae bacterium]
MWRQIHPVFVQNGRVLSPAFRPTKKDEGRLSVSDGSKISAEDAWKQYSLGLGYDSNGVLGVTHQECEVCKTTVQEAPLEGQPYHMEIDFNALNSSGEIDRAAKMLCRFAVNRGWMFSVTQNEL